MLWDLSSLAFGQVLSVALGFVGFAYLARTLSPASYGLVEYVVGLSALAAIVIEGGMGAIGTLGIARDPRRARELAAAVPAARLAVALAIIPLMGLSTYVTGLNGGATTLTWLFALSLLAIPFKQDWLLQGLDRMAWVAPAQAIRTGAFAAAVVMLVRDPTDLARVGAAEGIAALLATAYFLLVQRRLAVPVALDLRPARAWESIRSGASVGASNILWPFMTYAPVLLVTYLAGSAEAAWLGAAQRIVIALVSFSALYFFNLYPLIARVLRDDPAAWQRLMRSSVRLVAWSSIALAVVTAWLAEPLVATVFGAPFAAAGPVLALSIWLLPLRLLSGHARWTLLAAERQHLLLLVELGCAASIVGFSLLLIPDYGAAGAAAAGVAGNVIGWSLAHGCAARCVGRVPVGRELLWPVGAAVAASIAAWLADGPAALDAVVAVAVFALCLRLAAGDLFADAVRLAYAKKTAAVTDSDGS